MVMVMVVGVLVLGAGAGCEVPVTWSPCNLQQQHVPINPEILIKVMYLVLAYHS